MPFQIISLRAILILSSNLYLGVPNIFFSTGFPTKHLYVFLLYPSRATRSIRLTLLHCITRTKCGEQCKP